MILDDLRLETHHRGHVLIVRTFGHPLKYQSVHNAVEDSEGSVERLAIYNCDPKLEGSQILPQGGLVAVKEPYYKMTSDGMPTIRVDHPTDLVRLEEDDELVPVKLQLKLMDLPMLAASALKEEGNIAFRAKKYPDAITQYSRALKVCDSNDFLTIADLHRNRAIANLNLSRFEAALRDAEAAVITDSDDMDLDLVKVNSKAFYRAGCAAYHLENFKKAKEYFTKVIDISSFDANANRELRRTNSRLAEQLKGCYDFEALSKSVTEDKRRLDRASYTAKVAIRDTVDRGKGLFAVGYIKAGELVFCEKAFSLAFEDEEGGNTSVVLNLNRDSIHMGTHASRLVNTVQKLVHNPKQAAEFFRLYDGGYSPKSSEVVEDGLLAVDTFRIQTILEYNGFGCPRTTNLEHTDSKSGSSTSVWLMASFANYDCIGNANRAFIGDMMVVYANRDISKDQEITMQYKNHEPDTAAFQDNLQKVWKFRCSCVLCQAEAKVPRDRLRYRIDAIKQIDEFLSSPANKYLDQKMPAVTAIRKAEQLYDKARSTYDDKLFRSLPRLALQNLSLWLCMAYASKRPEKVLDQALVVLQNNGILVKIEKDDVTINRDRSRLEVSSIHSAMYAAEGFEGRGQMKASRKMTDLAAQLYRIAYGSRFKFDQLFN